MVVVACKRSFGEACLAIWTAVVDAGVVEVVGVVEASAVEEEAVSVASEAVLAAVVVLAAEGLEAVGEIGPTRPLGPIMTNTQNYG